MHRCIGIDLLPTEEFWINHITLMTSEGSLTAGHDPLHRMVDCAVLCRRGLVYGHRLIMRRRHTGI